MLDVLPIGVMVFPGTGIQNDLADKAKRLGIPVWRFDDGGAWAPHLLVTRPNRVRIDADHAVHWS